MVRSKSANRKAEEPSSDRREGEEVERERMREEDRLKGSTVLNRRGRSAALDGRGLSRASDFPRL
ncbi:hypothetical protein K402DRAFT_398839 [Aulographum hederae CBS 113979]|uniref:Uncharacterized protein n=1 Tax=Aulographum hederae CBS 113979 TaxID=1176131 RepID=A0A6G1GJL1_9PEZI|nr:hypothetical protein K402DRAFT_398839 [Aulographum hederae CBS 113979]